MPNTANFSSSEVSIVAAGARVYSSTADGSGNLTVVTDRSSAAPPGLQFGKRFAQTSLPPGGATTLTVGLTVPPAACAPALVTPASHHGCSRRLPCCPRARVPAPSGAATERA